MFCLSPLSLLALKAHNAWIKLNGFIQYYINYSKELLTVFKEQQITAFSWLWELFHINAKTGCSLYVRWILSQSDLKLNLHSCFALSSSPCDVLFKFKMHHYLQHKITGKHCYIHPSSSPTVYVWLHPVNKEKKKWAGAVPASLCYYVLSPCLPGLTRRAGFLEVQIRNISEMRWGVTTGKGRKTERLKKTTIWKEDK